MKVKVCGLTNREHVEKCIQYNVDFCGFILNYSKSHRYIDYKTAKELTSIKKGATNFVGVLVDPKRDEFEKFSKLNLDYFQIYGDYNQDDINNIKNKYNKKIIFSIQVKEKEDVLNYKKIMKSADIILWDSSGLQESLTWNYEWIKSIPNNFTKMVAGNITIDKLEYISTIADIVDVSGALETNKVKDINKIKKFLEKIKKINDEN
ncbi:phosphoribosylanthranilate isomerase [Pelagibacteraceae bacterium]|nr:phosphoribosylanthranilate isomerase [Pelagibacteraceae bacterium]|tara:strand:- start:550 stop:1167 length:618 start_codon:yes stop_codon:yes gene_type:complete